MVDDQFGIGTDNIIITINGVNDEPVMGPTLTQSMTEDDVFVTENVSSIDVDNYYTITYEVKISGGDYSGYAHGEFGSLTINATSGYWKYTLTENLITVLNQDQVTTDVFVVRVTDDQGGVGTDNIIVTINGVNDDPEMARTLTQSMTEDDDDVTANVSSVDVDTYHTATYSIKVKGGVYGNYIHGEFGSITLNKESGYWKYRLTENILTQLNEGDVTTDVFIIKVVDDHFGICLLYTSDAADE